MPHTKDKGFKNIVFEHTYSARTGWSTSATAYFQGYAPASYVNFIPYIPNCTLDMVRNGGPSSQAHPCLRHIADIAHSQCWQVFQREVEKGKVGVFVGSKYAKDFKRALEVFDLPWRSLLSGFPGDARRAIEVSMSYHL